MAWKEHHFSLNPWAQKVDIVTRAPTFLCHLKKAIKLTNHFCSTQNMYLSVISISLVGVQSLTCRIPIGPTLLLLVGVEREGEFGSLQVH